MILVKIGSTIVVNYGNRENIWGHIEGALMKKNCVYEGRHWSNSIVNNKTLSYSNVGMCIFIGEVIPSVVEIFLRSRNYLNLG